MYKLILGLSLFIGISVAQSTVPLTLATVDPTGNSCTTGYSPRLLPTGIVYTCQSGTVHAATAAGAPGTVTSVIIAGTTNEITATGTCTVTTTGTCTLSLPTAVLTDTIGYCADAGMSDTYACTLAPAQAAYVTGGRYRFKANTANTGAATINFNAIGAKTIVKVSGGITTTLADNDILAGQIVDLVYDGTNMQMQSTLGNAASGGGITIDTTAITGGVDCGIIYEAAGKVSQAATNFCFQTAVPAPVAPIVVVTGGSGTSYAYKQQFVFPWGRSAPSVATTVSAAAMLDGSNYNTITAAACTGVGETVDIFLTTPAGQGWIANVACSGSYQDMSGMGYGEPQTTNASIGGLLGGSWFMGNGSLTPAQDWFNQGGVPSILTASTSITAPTTNSGGGLSNIGLFHLNTVNFSASAANDAVESNSFYTKILGSQNIGSVEVINGQMQLGGSGNVDLAIGDGFGLSLGTSGTVSRGVAVQGVIVDVDGTNTETNVFESWTRVFGGTNVLARGLRVRSTQIFGSLTNNIGIEVEDQTGATNNLAIKTGLGKIQWGDVEQEATVVFASLPSSPVNGMMIFCSDCQPTTVTMSVIIDATCKAMGTGALAVRINSKWNCAVNF